MALPAIENYDDDKLTDLRDAVLAEIERRDALKRIPAQVAELRTKFLEGGGDPAELEPAPTPQE